MTRAAFLALSHDDLIDLILGGQARIEAQAEQISSLYQKLEVPTLVEDSRIG